MSHTLAQTYQYASQFVRLTPLSFAAPPAGARANDPALSIGDWVRQFILSPPFAWRWNRASASFLTIIGQQDYTVAAATFGWLERAVVTVAGVARELNIHLTLAPDSTQNLPIHIAAQEDNGAGNIVFRLLPVPDKIYTVGITYQLAAPTFVATAGLWTPIPDYMYYIYSQGVLAKAYEYLGDERWAGALQLFLKQLISFHGGLTESQVNLFMGERIATQTGLQAALTKVQQAVLARGLQ